MGHFVKFVQLTKVDEAKREVGGIVTAEVPDKDGEVCEYETTKPYYEAWSDEFARATDGKSLGNLRIMHGLEAAGVGKALVFNDEQKTINMTFKVVDDAAWKGVQEGMYTGFSQGGNYIKQWKGKDGNTWYTAQPTEVSLVDNPALGLAHFEFIRANGQSEIRKFARRSEENMDPKDTPAPASGSVQLTVSPETITEIVAKTTASVIAHLKKSTEKVVVLMKDLTAEQLKTLKEALLPKCEDIMHRAAERRGLQKGLYEVSRFAQILCDLAYLRMSTAYEREYEGDGSTIPDDILEDLESLADTFLAMAQEETKELITSAESAGKTGGMLMSTQAAALAKAARSVADHINKMSKAVVDHHEKMAEVHKAHAEEMHDHCTKLHKMLGTEEAQAMGDNNPEPLHIGKTAEATPPAAVPAAAPVVAPAGVEKTYTTAELQEAVTKAASEAANAAVQEVIKALKGDDDEDEDDNKEKPAKKAAAAAGIGSRQDVPVVAINAGPAIRVVPVTKTQDAPAAAAAASAPANDQPVDMGKALGGDPVEALKLMKGAVPTNAVPATVAAALGGRRGGR